MEYISKACKFSPCKKYRYVLSRSWQQGTGRVVFVALNPSTADGIDDDPTIRRCAGFAASWGFDRMDVLNLFAYRATQPKRLLAAKNPIGTSNDHWLHKSLEGSDLAIACWGNQGNYLHRSTLLKNRYPYLQCIKITAQNQPAHPLYLSAGLAPRPY